MPSSYREPDDREGDRIVYFDYAKSLESRRRPIPWKDVGRAALFLGFTTFTGAAIRVSGEPWSIAGCLVFAVPAMLLALGLIPVLRSNRALSGDNFVEARRREK